MSSPFAWGTKAAAGADWPTCTSPRAIPSSRLRSGETVS